MAIDVVGMVIAAVGLSALMLLGVIIGILAPLSCATRRGRRRAH